MIKVLLNAYSEFPSPNQGGPNKIIYEILKSIDRKIFEPHYLSKHLFSFIEEKENLEESVNEQLSLIKTTSVKLIKNSRLFKKIVSNSFYMRYHFEKANSFYRNFDLGKMNFNVFHSHDVKSFALLHSKIKRTKKVLTIHTKGPIKDDVSDYLGNPSILTGLFRRFDMMEDEALSEADVITFPSYAALEIFKSKKNISNKKVKIIYNGINPDLVQKINTSISFEKVFQLNTKPYLKIINIADHIETKNIEIVIEVLHQLIRNMNVKVLFINIGTGPLTKKYLSEAKELSITENVRFLGKLRNDDVLTLLKDADYLINPAERVIFDYIILEALACGTTVIASDIGGNKEIITHNENGYLLKELNPESISSQFNLFPKIESKRLQNSLEKFSHLRMINEYQNLYL
jgi:glycosyltransferase involved in cell wall biosynthesis